MQINSLPIWLANHFIDQKSPIIFGKAPPEDSLHSHGRRMLVDGTIDRQGIAHRGPSAASTKLKKLKPSTRKEGHHTSPILIDDTPPQSQSIPKQKLVPIVEIWNHPPPRPLKASKGKKPACEVVPVDLSSDVQVSLESDAEDEFKEDKDALESEDSEHEDEVATSHKHKVKGTRGHCSQKRHAPSSDVQAVEPPHEGRKAVKGKGKVVDQDTGKEQKIAKRVHYVSVAAESDTEQDCEQSPLHYMRSNNPPSRT